MKTAQCALCAKAFRYRPNKRYCSEKCRFQGWMRGKGEPNIKPCYYCGMPATTIDHVPPRCVRPTLLEMNEQRWPFHEVDACHECNSIINAEPPWTLAERKKRIKEKLKKKYGRYLRLPEWSDIQLDEFDDRSILRQHIAEGKILKEATEKRLNW